MGKPKDNKDLFNLAVEDIYYERNDSYTPYRDKSKKNKSVKKPYKDYDRFDKY